LRSGIFAIEVSSPSAYLDVRGGEVEDGGGKGMARRRDDLEIEASGGGTGFKYREIRDQ
jgi:hypothetical protein